MTGVTVHIAQPCPLVETCNSKDSIVIGASLLKNTGFVRGLKVWTQLDFAKGR